MIISTRQLDAVKEVASRASLGLTLCVCVIRQKEALVLVELPALRQIIVGERLAG